MLEIGLKGNIEEKMNFVKEFWGKEITIKDVFENTDVVDVHGVTKGKGFTGPIKRFGIGLRSHKSEKGVRGPGAIGSFTPRRITFRAPLAGQLGFFNRFSYNTKVVEVGKISERDINRKGGFKHYGVIKTDYIMLRGSVQGPQKRPILLTSTMRPNKKQTKQKFEFIELE